MVGRIFVCGVTTIVLALANDSLVQNYQKDDPVVVITHGELKMGHKAVDKIWPGLVMNVEAINGDWLWVRHGKSGWLHKSFVIPVDRQAIDKLTALIKANPRDAYLYAGRAHAWLVVKDYSRAIDDYYEAIRLDPAHREFSDDLVTVCEWMNVDDDKAIAVFSKLIELNPREKTFYFGRATAWSSKKEYDKAIADYDQGLRIDPNDINEYMNRGSQYLHKKDYDQAIKHYNEVIRRRPQDEIVYSNRARAWFLLRDYDKAIADYDHAIQYSPHSVHEYWWRGEAWLMKEEYAKAMADFNQSNDLARMWQKEQPFFLRAVTQMLLRQPDCVNGFQETIELCEWKGERAPDAAILGSVAARLNGDQERSDKFLRDAVQNVKEEWAIAVVKHLQGEVPESALLEIAASKGKLTEVHCFLGLDAIAKHRDSTAHAHFLWIDDRGDQGTLYYAIARADLKPLKNKD